MMGELKHTPGPWELDPSVYKRFIDKEYHFIRAGNGTISMGGFTISACISETDGRLVTAAPDLLEALIELTARTKVYGAFADQNDANGQAHQRALQAIAKATGQEAGKE